MGKQYKVKDINKNNKIDTWEQAKYDKINQSQGAAQFGIIKHLNAGGNISELLKSPPGSQSVLKPNRSVNNMSNMVRQQQPRQLMGMNVSTNAQILNQAYDPRMAVNNMQGPAQVNQVEPTPNNKYGRNPNDYHKDANLNERYPRRKASDPRSKTHQKNLKKEKGPAQYQVPNPNEKSKKPEPKINQKSREERRNEEREKTREQIRKEMRERMKQKEQEENKKRNEEARKKMKEPSKKKKEN